MSPINRFTATAFQDTTDIVIPYYQYKRGYILPVKQNMPKNKMDDYISLFFSAIMKNRDAMILDIHFEKGVESSYIVIDIGDILSKYILSSPDTLLPLYRALHLIEVSIREEKETKYLHNGVYVPIPHKFDSIVSYKNWLQGGFAGYGWNFWSGIFDPDEINYSASRAMYNACLNVNHGRKSKKIPWAKIFFKELKKIEKRYRLK